MAVYCDSSLLVRLYADLPDSPPVLERFEHLRDDDATPIPVTWLHQLETANAFEQLVFLTRAGRNVRMTPDKAAVALARFDEDIADATRFVGTALVVPDLVRATRQLSLRHTARKGFRTYDVAHVASALLLECDRFWSFDAKANLLAKLEGLKTF